MVRARALGAAARLGRDRSHSGCMGSVTTRPSSAEEPASWRLATPVAASRSPTRLISRLDDADELVVVAAADALGEVRSQRRHECPLGRRGRARRREVPRGPRSPRSGTSAATRASLRSCRRSTTSPRFVRRAVVALAAFSGTLVEAASRTSARGQGLAGASDSRIASRRRHVRSLSASAPRNANSCESRPRSSRHRPRRARRLLRVPHTCAPAPRCARTAARRCRRASSRRQRRACRAPARPVRGRAARQRGSPTRRERSEWT